MSRVYFHTQNGPEVELRGSERAWCGGAVDDVAVSLISTTFPSEKSYVLDYMGIPQGGLPFKLLFSVHGSEKTVSIDGETVDLWSLVLNTAWVVGSLQLQLMAALHAQCEIHAWIDEPDHKWFAGIIKGGRESGLYRPNAGWEDVIQLLETPGIGPVVMSYSVTDQFPNPSLAVAQGIWQPAPDDEDYDAWYHLPYDQQWAQGMEALRKSDGGLQWTRKGWDKRWFGSSSKRLTVMDLERVARTVEENRPGTSYGRIYTQTPATTGTIGS